MGFGMKGLLLLSSHDVISIGEFFPSGPVGLRFVHLSQGQQDISPSSRTDGWATKHTFAKCLVGLPSARRDGDTSRCPYERCTKVCISEFLQHGAEPYCTMSYRQKSSYLQLAYGLNMSGR